MNLLTISDHKLSSLRQKVAQEVTRRSKIATNGHDAAVIIYGNEAAKRALIVAVAGKHSIQFIGPSNSGKTMLRAVALELGLADTCEFRCCPCGNRSDPRAVCSCTVRQVERHIRKAPVADISVETCRPTHRETGVVGTTLADMREQIDRKSDYASTELGPHETSLFRAVVGEMGLDPAVQQTILAVARTIANLDNCDRIECSHLMEAVNYRALLR